MNQSRDADSKGEATEVERTVRDIPDPASLPDSRIQNLVSHWHTLRGQGIAITIAELCADCPDLEGEVTEQLCNADPLVGRSVSVKSKSVPLEQPVKLGRYTLQNLLGAGAYGTVYRAYDEELQRWVAVKIPHTDELQPTASAAAFLREARQAAQLDHSHILSVYDTGQDEGRCFIVYKLVEGCNLQQAAKLKAFSHREAALLVAQVAEALDYAHRRGLYHRDIKPGNILIDHEGRPYIADFGLAVRESELSGQRGHRAGTVPYMSPEQIRGEGHRIDGRSDIYSLGIVLYELLSGHRPFDASSKEELADQILHREARPPRQWQQSIPRELERICLKAISKRVTDRYTTAKDMAEELRRAVRSVEAVHATVNTLNSAEAATTAPREIPSELPLHIVPKGLRSFGPEDQDFFLELLPGPRDSEGLPDSIRFWKREIEKIDSASAFSVGLLYGPSGCGKSSLVKAGLLPRLAANIQAVYIEATRSDTERRLCDRLRQVCPGLGSTGSLPDLISLLRRGGLLPPRQKVVIILDQFEQWLHAHGSDEGAELIRALRQCDGEHVQCILMVRDDFWIAISRFMRELEIRLVEGSNFALVDLFDCKHARKVMTAFGRAYGCLPASPKELSDEQRGFIDTAVEGLAQDGKVISVRLSMFAEMMKGRPWTLDTLKEVGGIEGIGITFLEECFTSRSANPQHRVHERAARSVLALTVAEAGTEIRGRRHSYQELLQASGYESRPHDFTDLLRILDSELRLLTPTDVPWEPAKSESTTEPRDAQYYQLTHDYLVPVVRDWLARKQKESRRGRAQLCLTERAGLWNSKPRAQHLPALSEWLRILFLTARSSWQPAEARMMRAASRYYLIRTALSVAVAFAVVGVGWTVFRLSESERAKYAHGLTSRLINADIAQVPGLLAEIEEYRRWTDPLLTKYLADADHSTRQSLHALLGLLPQHSAAADPALVDQLTQRLLAASPREQLVVRQYLRPFAARLGPHLWHIATDSTTPTEQRLAAAAAVALFDSEDPRWTTLSQTVADQLTLIDRRVARNWITLFAPVQQQLCEHWMASIQRESTGTDGDAGETAIRRQADAALLLLHVRVADVVWPIFEQRPDPRLRSNLIHTMAQAGIPPDIVLEHLKETTNAGVRFALLLSLGEYAAHDFSSSSNLLTFLETLYSTDSDPGVHSAVEWLLRHWNYGNRVMELEHAMRSMPSGDRNWYVNAEGHTMAIIPHELRAHNRPLISVATKEVTVTQFRQFDAEHEYIVRYSPEPQCPMNNINLHDAMRYCLWLSERNQIPQDQMCYYRPEPSGELRPVPDYVKRSGYRLPTAEEWVLFCRAGTTTKRFYGDQDEWLSNYVWFSDNSQARSWPVGMLRPNRFGLFDSLGNAVEWTDSFQQSPMMGNSPTRSLLQGGSFRSFSQQVGMDAAAIILPLGQDMRQGHMGFRVARTVH